MQQLSGVDASFLYFETPDSPHHIASLAIYDPGTAPGGDVRFDQILANVERRLHLARCFRQKLVRVPLDLDHPYWIEDPSFDLEFHVRHIALPGPGDWRQLCDQAARLHARPLDPRRPLWELYVIDRLDHVEGAPAGAFAVLTKIHHAAIDGVSGAELVGAIHDTEPGGEPPPPDERWKPEPDPPVLELAARTLVNHLRNPMRFAGVVGHYAPGALRWLRRNPERERLASEGEVPRTRFNATVSPHRVFDARSFPLHEIGEIRKRIPGATVNDVVLAICSGALRRYLDHHGELPASSLKAMAPISVRADEEAGAAGNLISAMTVWLHSEEPDPLERLDKIHLSTRSSKSMNGAIGARALTDIGQFMPGALAGLAARLFTGLRLADSVKPLVNTLITNVPGPQVPLYFTGARMLSFYGLGPVVDSMGLIQPVFSYAGRISIAFTSCREQLPDPAFYAECLEASFAELRDAARLPTAS